MKNPDLIEMITRQRAFFNAGDTLSVSFRIEQLRRLRRAIKQREDQICDALWQDLHKPKMEAFMTEVGSVIKEISYVIRMLRFWCLPRLKPTLLEQLPALSLTMREPYGLALVISPWNYPFNLVMAPLIGAIAGGNCTVIKTGHAAAKVAEVIGELIADNFSRDYISVFHGGRDVNTALLQQHWDTIFFTGSTALGRVVMEAAAQHVTPVTLELGGKSPVVVTKAANLKITARRLMWGKMINAGQTCIAPDYLLVDSRVREELFERMHAAVVKMYGANPKESPDFGRIINDEQFERLTRLLEGAQVVFGGETDAAERYIAPTLLEKVSFTDPVMGEEIFGPILPAIEIKSLDDAIDIIRTQPKPLALYLFSECPYQAHRVARETSSGGLTINDAVVQIANHNLPFGGVGASGTGQYHGRASFETFTHRKSVFHNVTWIDPPVRYAPYREWALKMVKLVQR